MSRVRRWTFTLNNPGEEEESLLQGLYPGLLTYIIYGHEQGEQGTPHLQGYLETKSKIGLQPLKSKMGLNRIHLEQSRGSAQSNRDYCTKEGRGGFEAGTPMQQVISFFLINPEFYIRESVMIWKKSKNF